MRVRNGTAMLATRPRDAHRTAALFLILLLIGLTGSSFVGLAAADLPRLRDNLDGTRTVTWRMNDAEGLTLQGVDLVKGNATLPWLHSNITWSSASQFAANALSVTNISYDANGITLRADSSNHVPDGNFSTGSPWSFEPSSGGNVTAWWDQGAETGRFSHDSAASASVWDAMDSHLPWVGVGGQDWTNRTGSHDGSGMVGLNFTLPDSPGAFAGIYHQVSVNWSAYDRMVLWVLPLNVSSPLTFNVTAFVGATFHQTTAQSLSGGWQELVVDLTELGPARDSLVTLTLRINGRNVPSTTTVYFDDLRVGNTKRFDETGWIHQSIDKASPTSSALGSGVLQFNWSLPNASGVVRVSGFVNLTGPSGSFERPFGGSSGAGWNRFEADVSGTTAAQGTYDVGFRVEVAADNTSASSVDVRVDDVSLVFPDRHNGTFLSNAVGPGAASEYLRVDWGIEAGGPSTVRMALRSGNSTSPGSPTWSAWETWTAPGMHSLTIPGARYVQVWVVLNTTNASVSPIVHAMDLETRHRAPQGSIVSSVFPVPDVDRPLLHWRFLRAVWNGSSGSSLSFSVGDVSYWQPVSSNGDLSSFTLTSIRWNASLTTTNGLVAPTLERVEVVYDVLASGGGGWFAGIPYLPYALALLVASVLGYAGYEFVIRRMFAIDDIFLISKDGRLMLHNTRRMRADRDEDILSAMLTAILTFLRDFDPEESGGLRRFDIGGKMALLERGTHVYLAAVYSGRVPRWAGKDLRRFMSNLETRFGPTFARWTGSPQDLQGLKEFSEKFVSRVRYRPGRGARRQAG